MLSKAGVVCTALFIGIVAPPAGAADTPGWPYYGGFSPWAYPYYPYPYYPAYYPSPMVVQQQPTTYVEQPAPQAQQQAPTGFWYYCADQGAYYPYINECPAGWQRVAPRPSN